MFSLPSTVKVMADKVTSGTIFLNEGKELVANRQVPKEKEGKVCV